MRGGGGVAVWSCRRCFGFGGAKFTAQTAQQRAPIILFFCLFVVKELCPSHNNAIPFLDPIVHRARPRAPQLGLTREPDSPKRTPQPSFLQSFRLCPTPPSSSGAAQRRIEGGAVTHTPIAFRESAIGGARGETGERHREGRGRSSRPIIIIVCVPFRSAPANVSKAASSLSLATRPTTHRLHT